LHKIKSFKKMKVLKSLLILGFITASLTIYSQTDCFPNQPGCTEIATDLQDVIVLPNYPGCPITVTYDLRVCQGESQIANVSVGLPDDGGACGVLIMDALEALFSGNQLNSETFLKNFWSAVETEIADILWETTLASVGTNTQLLYCSDGLTTFTAGFYRGSCVSFCFSRDPELGDLNIDLVSCGQTCCVKRRAYCLDPSTEELVLVETTEQVNEGECILLDRPECPL
jgi:hypothetical protein